MRKMTEWNQLAKYLKKRSREICADNECSEDNHNCDSYAYIAEYGFTIICLPDYFPGFSVPYAAIPLPFAGAGKELKEQVTDQFCEACLDCTNCDNCSVIK